MRKSLLLAAVLGAFSVPAAVMAEEAAAPASPYTVSYNLGLYSQYIFRGLTQTGKEPALQGGVDLSHESGFYAGAWGSNVSWLEDGGYKKDASLEVDVYGGYTAEIGDTGISYDLGAYQYLYPGSKVSGTQDANTTEVYAGAGWKWFKAKYSYVVSSGAFGISNGRGTDYTELNAVFPIYDSGYAVIGHAGYQGFDGSGNDHASYSDYKLGLTKTWDNGVNVGGYYTYASTTDRAWTINNENIGKDQVTFFVQKTF